MPVVKGGVWSNIEDEILKAAVSKYGLNQWARVSSLLARKTPKQCKARWAEWLDPGIRKIEWSKEEDEKLLHLAKLMPTQWRTIAPIVGRTATQCLERYQHLLDEAEQRESGELGLAGPAGGEGAAPSADDVRKLRPGELDPDPESKPARPDTIDLDEDEKEMLSEARARLANTQGKKAKRKARERQLEESRRLAVLQKRRELKTAGINIKVVTRKNGEMDYNADIPFEKAPAVGFFDTMEEESRNERQREMFDPRKQQLANKRKGDQDEDKDDNKRRKSEKGGKSAGLAAAMKAGQMQKIREAERSSKRRPLNLPAPQVNERELDEIVKMGMLGERANEAAGASDNDATRGWLTSQRTLVGATPIRTPRAPQEEDRVANEIKNARARTETQSALLGGENAPLSEGSGTTGYEGVAPSKQQTATPNPLATPFRQAGPNGVGSSTPRTPMGPGMTPMRTPRDNFRLNQEDADGTQLTGRTPRDLRRLESANRQSVRAQLASLPKPQQTDWELEMPEEQEETAQVELSEEDAAERDRRGRELRDALLQAEYRRQTQVVQKGLPRPTVIDIDAMLHNASSLADPAHAAIAADEAVLIANDALKFGGATVKGSSRPVEVFEEEYLQKARLEIALEVSADEARQSQAAFDAAWERLHGDEGGKGALPGLQGYGEDEIDEGQLLVEAFDNIQESITEAAQRGSAIEKTLSLHLGGYAKRARTLRQKIIDMAEALEKVDIELDSARTMQVGEEAAMARRLEELREQVGFCSRREREVQEVYRQRKMELDSLGEGENGVGVNGER